MAKEMLQIPSDRNSEIYFDPEKMFIGFRRRETSPLKSGQETVLRIVIQVFGAVVEDRLFEPGSKISVGMSRRATFRIPTINLPKKHTLFEYGLDGSIHLSLNGHFHGVLEEDQKLLRVEERLKSKGPALENLVLRKHSKGCLEHGNILIYFEEIPHPDRIPPTPIFKNLADQKFFRWVLVSLIIHLLLLLIVWMIPATKPQEITLEDLKPSFQKIIVQPSKVEQFQPKLAVSASSLSRGPQGMEGEGARAPGREGRRGKGIPGAQRGTSSGKTMSTKDVNQTGVLNILSRSGKSSALSSLIGSGSGLGSQVESGFNRAARYGLPGEREIKEGKGLQGTGTGGGGLSTSIGQGLGTKGKGGGQKGPGLADFGTGKSGTLVSASIDDEEVFIMGNISKEEIARLINNYLGQIQYCYERELTVNPDLRGKLVTDFVIGLQGRVTSTKVKSSTLANANVENCVLRVIQRIPFPKPGGGVVQVFYPFLFRVAR